MAFFFSGKILYKRNPDGTLSRCVDGQKAHLMMFNVHEEIYGTHANGHTMARKIMRSDYYWFNMEADCIEYVQKCHKC